jgi:mRNA interferase RelE/StbE
VAIRVELTAEASEDLDAVSKSGRLNLFLSKLLQLEQQGAAAGQPLRRDLMHFRKIVVGDRNWRIIFTVDPQETVATVWVIGDRADDACYCEAIRRLERLGDRQVETSSLARAMHGLLVDKRKPRR